MIKPRIIVQELAANLAMKVPMLRRRRIRRGRTMLDPNPEGQARKFIDQFNFFLDALGAEAFEDRIILEIGPGDAIPLAMLFLGVGARKYVAVDRFMGDVAGAYPQQIYQQLAILAPPMVQQGWRKRGLDPCQFPWISQSSSLIDLYRVSLESMDGKNPPRADIIFSFNVVEHLSSPDISFKKMAELLSPCGMMVHRIDYGPHGPWLKDENPLTFLTLADTFWEWMGSARGYPNRARHSDIQNILNKNGFTTESRVLQEISAAQVNSIQPRLARRYRDKSVSDLQIMSACLISRKMQAQPHQQ